MMASLVVLCCFTVASGLRVNKSSEALQDYRVDFVVAAYKESTSFIDLIMPNIPGAKLTLYCAGPAPDPRCVRVENVNDEIPIYLKHIIDNYDSGLAPITLFSLGSAGKPEWGYLLCRKLNYVVSKLDTIEKQNKFPGFATMAHTDPSTFLMFSPNFDVSSYRAHTGKHAVKHCRPSVAPLGEWYKTFVDSDLDRARRIGVAFNDIFAVSAKHVKKWPKSTYQRLYDEVYRCKGVRATAGHYMERTFKAMWDTDPPQNKVPDATPGPNVCPIIAQLEKEHDIREAHERHVASVDEWFVTPPDWADELAPTPPEQ